MASYFDTKAKAARYFRPLFYERDGLHDPDAEPEACECCGRWTASRADLGDEGGILGPWVEPTRPEDCQGIVIFDRICEDCSDETTDESLAIRETISRESK